MNGRESTERGMDPKYGLMELATRVNSRTTKPTVLVSSGILMVIRLWGSGWMTKLTVRECTNTPTAPAMKATGRMTCKMATAPKFGILCPDEFVLGLMAPSMMGTTWRDANQVGGRTNGQMDPISRVIGCKTKSQVRESIHGPMEGYIL